MRYAACVTVKMWHHDWQIFPMFVFSLQHTRSNYRIYSSCSGRRSTQSNLLPPASPHLLEILLCYAASPSVR